MKMFIQITLCALLILGFAWLLRMLGCALLTPVRSSRDARLTLILTDDAAALCERAARRCEDLKVCKTEEICQWMQTSTQ